MFRFKHPEIQEGTVSCGGEVYKIVDGCFEVTDGADAEAFRAQFQELPAPAAEEAQDGADEEPEEEQVDPDDGAAESTREETRGGRRHRK